MLDAAMRVFTTESFNAFFAPISVRGVINTVLCDLGRSGSVWGSDSFLRLHFFLLGGYLLACHCCLVLLPHVADSLHRYATQDVVSVKVGAYGMRRNRGLLDYRSCRVKG